MVTFDYAQCKTPFAYLEGFYMAQKGDLRSCASKTPMLSCARKEFYKKPEVLGNISLKPKESP